MTNQKRNSMSRTLFADWRAASPDTRLKVYVALSLGIVAAAWAVYVFFSGGSPLNIQQEDSREESRPSSPIIGGPQNQPLAKSTQIDELGRLTPNYNEEAAKTAEPQKPRPEEAVARRPLTEKLKYDSAFWTDLRKPTALAVMLVDQNREPLPRLAQLVVNHTGGTASFFSTAFLTSGGFDDTLGGDPSVLVTGHIQRQAAAVLLGEISVEETRDSHDTDLVVVGSTCEATLFRSRDWQSPLFIRATGRGVEYRKERAEEEAEVTMISDLINRISPHLKGESRQ